MRRPEHVDVAVVGGGPVGLFLAGLLIQRGMSCVVLEKKRQPNRHARAIGIHPPALERLAQLGVAQSLLARGVKIQEGRAFINTQPLGTLSFASCPPPYRFVLSLPQCDSESILAARVCALSPGALHLGCEVSGLTAGAGRTAVHYRHGHQHHTLQARFVAGCDGKHSALRRLLKIPFEGGPYPDRYLMGDVPDSTGLGSKAAIYLCDEGLVESFPLPSRQRRWVVKTADTETPASLSELQKLIQTRLHHQIPTETAGMVSSFGVERYLAHRFVSGRAVLVGDAAHIVSPIGGQGMNLGWLDAWTLAEGLAQIFYGGVPHQEVLRGYQKARKRAAQAAIRRAEFNMMLGRTTRLKGFKNAFAWGLLHTPLRRVMADVFTMRGLE